MESLASVQYQRHERRRGGHDRVAEASRDLHPGAVAAGLRQRLPSGCEHDAFTLDGAACGHDSKAAAGSFDVEHAVAGNQMDASRAGSSKQCVQDVTRAPVDWKQLAVGFLVERHIEAAEELDGVGGP